MIKPQRLYSLIRSHASGDHERFFQMAETIALERKSAGDHKVHDHLQAVIVEGRSATQRRRAQTSLPADVAGKIEIVTGKPRLADYPLPPAIATQIREIIGEYRNAARLSEYGLQPSTRIAMSGPSGTGKTLSAGIVATELDLPLHIIRISSILDSYLGATSKNLAAIFAAIDAHPAVWFFDEFDAIASDREKISDVGEAKRIVNTLLQMMDRPPAQGLIMTATNLHHSLDTAILRRCDRELRFNLPCEETLARIIRKTLSAFEADLDYDSLGRAALGLSSADAIKNCLIVARNAVIHHDAVLDEARLRDALSCRGDVQKPGLVESACAA